MLLVNRLTLLAKMDIQHDPFYNYVKNRLSQAPGLVLLRKLFR